jgi:DpnII restriction endonuclease
VGYYERSFGGANSGRGLPTDRKMVDQKQDILKKLAVRVDGLRRAMDAVIGGTTPDHGKWRAFKNYARAYNTFAVEYRNVTGDRTIHVYDVEKIKKPGSTVWSIQKEIFDTIYADTLILSGLLATYDTGISASISEIQDLLVANLRKVIFRKPEAETDIKDAVESLLIGRGYQKSIDYEREAGKVRFSGREFIPDFVFPPLSLALEVKFIKEQHQISRCIEEMCADIPAYLSHYKSVLFCVYDLGHIRDLVEFQAGLQKQSGVRICVVKH